MAKNVAKKRPAETVPSKTARVRDYLARNPGAGAADIVVALSAFGVTRKDVQNAKARAVGPDVPVRRPASRVALRRPDGVEMRVVVPPGGVRLQVAVNGGWLVGTLVLTEMGLSFIRPKAKKPVPEIAYSALSNLYESGLLG